MRTIEESGTIARWEERLGEAARRFTEHAIGPRCSPRETEATLLRLGFPLAEVGAVLRNRLAVSADRLGEMRRALACELASLSRRAKAGRFDYDLNRHIAVFRAARHLEEPGSRPQPSPGSTRRAARAARSSPTASLVRSSIRL